MYKYLIIAVNLFWCFTLLSCSKNNTYGKLNFIDLRTQTVIDVSCEQLKIEYVTKKKDLNRQESQKLLQLFTNLKKADADWKINARIFGYIKEGSGKIEFCMGNNIININGINYFVNENLRNYILIITAIK